MNQDSKAPPVYPEFESVIQHHDPEDCSVIEMPDMEFWNNKSKTEEEKQHIVNRARTLQAGINLPYETKVKNTKKIIKRALEREPVSWAVSFSGGRDSTVLSHLMVVGMGITSVPHVMSNTRMEYPETIKQCNRWYSMLRERGVDCSVAYPEERPEQLWKRIGVPLWSKMHAYKYRKYFNSPNDIMSDSVPENLKEQFRKAKAAGLKITEKCCDYLKKKPMKKWDKERGINGHFTGVRCSEARNRRLAWIRKGALYYASSHYQWMCNPMAFWTEDDVERYLKENEIHMLRPDTLNGGSGCVTCMFGCISRAQEGTLNNMQDLKKRNPKMWARALDHWGYREVLDELGVPYE